jgi:broad specificity phosphatase PhoE
VSAPADPLIRAPHETAMKTPGDATIGLIEQALAAGADHVAVLMRHSAREFVPGRNDLENPLTDEGRELARRMGRALPKSALVRGYASPADRCMETTALLLEGHSKAGGQVARHRPVEGLGVFYALDQMRMFKAMTAAMGQRRFLSHWFQGDVEGDVMMPADLAARLVAEVVSAKLSQPLSRPQLDLCVSHDMTLYLVRGRLLGIEPSASEVGFLDGMAFYRQGDDLVLASLDGAKKTLSLKSG